MKEKSKYFLGLSLGQPHQFSALAVLERIGRAGKSTLACRHLERWPPGTPYADIKKRLVGLCSDGLLARATLVLDRTAIGKHVVDLLRRDGPNANWRLATVTTGLQAGQDERGGWLLPRNELVGVLQVLLQSQRLKVANTLSEAALLVRELTSFRARQAPLSDVAQESWRDGEHDDLVLAVASAAWFAERNDTVDVRV